MMIMMCTACPVTTGHGTCLCDIRTLFLFRQDMKRPAVDDAYYPAKRQAVDTRDQSSSFNYSVYQSGR